MSNSFPRLKFTVLPPISRLPSELQHYFWTEQCRTPAIINIAINGVIAWFLFGAHSRIPLWGGADVEVAFAPDILITSILLPLLICLITTPLIRTQVDKGKVANMPKELQPRNGPGKRPLIVRAVLLGVAGIAVAALPLIAILSIAGIDALGPWSLIALKAVWAGVLAAMVSPWIAWWAISDASRSIDPDEPVDENEH